MFSRSLVVILTLLGPVVLWGSTDLEEPADAYTVSTAVAMTLLPDPLGEFFADSHADLIASAVVGPLPKSSGLATSDGLEEHYIMLDAAAVRQDFATRQAAALAFPRNLKMAKQFFKKHGQVRGGLLPWSLRDHVDGLALALERGDRGEIIQCAGVVIHLATDAALPFNVTVDRDGIVAGGLRWVATAGHPQASLPYCTARRRIQLGLISRIGERLSVEAVVAPQRYRPVASTIDEVFRVLIESNRALEELVRADREILTRLGVVDPHTFLNKRHEYFAAMEERVAPIIETRIESAGLLAARLIGLAWTKAGKPSPSAWTAASDALNASPASAGKVEKPPGLFVGSRNSILYHTARCAHALRIKPNNLVSFSSKEAAVKAGRKPCKSCGKKDR